MRRYLLQLARFGVVGLSCFAVGLAVLVILHGVWGLNYLLAYAISFVVTNASGYLLNARFTFSARTVDHAGALRYMAVNAVLLGANTVALKVLVDGLGIWYVAAATLLAAINTPISFFGHRRITYRLQERNGAAIV